MFQILYEQHFQLLCFWTHGSQAILERIIKFLISIPVGLLNAFDKHELGACSEQGASEIYQGFFGGSNCQQGNGCYPHNSLLIVSTHSEACYFSRLLMCQQINIFRRHLIFFFFFYIFSHSNVSSFPYLD